MSIFGVQIDAETTNDLQSSGVVLGVDRINNTCSDKKFILIARLSCKNCGTYFPTATAELLDLTLGSPLTTSPEIDLGMLYSSLCEPQSNPSIGELNFIHFEGQFSMRLISLKQSLLEGSC